MSKQYRVASKRVDCKPKYKRYDRLADALRRMELYGPEPWKAYNADPTDLACCSGDMCGCNGRTHRQVSEERRASLPVLEWVRLESREVGAWQEEPSNA